MKIEKAEPKAIEVGNVYPCKKRGHKGHMDIVMAVSEPTTEDTGRAWVITTDPASGDIVWAGERGMLDFGPPIGSIGDLQEILDGLVIKSQ